mmetsp:Transcript_110608/g.292039  ORF Transcript_110608/g.292039 Transcript_110608/m.292039 type:complete len:243 (+) Transcript_110608:427-1155(+)
MKFAGSSLSLLRSSSKTDAKHASTICLSVRLRMRTSEWKAARSNSTWAFHMSFLSFIGTSDMTRLSSIIDFFVESTLADGYLTCSGKGLFGSAASKGSPERMPNFIISSATRQGSWNCFGVSHSTSSSTVMPPSSLDMNPRCSNTMKWTSAASEFRSFVHAGGPWVLMPLTSDPSFCMACLCQFTQNLKSTSWTPCRCISACTASVLMSHRRPVSWLRGWMRRAPSGRLASPTRPCRIGCGS